MIDSFDARTPAAFWREDGKPDPHGTRYEVERARLAMGNLTDDEVANAVFLEPNIMFLTAAKDRIRWLSRRLMEASILMTGSDHALRECRLQIEYLHAKFAPTGTGETTLAKIDVMLEALKKERELSSDRT